MPSLSGPLDDPAADAGWQDGQPRKGFFTDTSVCIGCKACEVACKEWNDVPADFSAGLLGSSYDNTGALGASTWRHVAFIEQPKKPSSQTVSLGMPSLQRPGAAMEPDSATEFRWLMSSDVCQHCTHAACLDVYPTGSLFRTEFGTVVVQDDICNGCGYCVPACPFGVIDRRIGERGDRGVGIAQKCTLCYDRLGAGNTPACAQACLTQSAQFRDVDKLRERAAVRMHPLQSPGVT
ncbi:MAG: 4Fe-4S dicluster domain-containing protein, partial [Jatrophihabitans sp.]